MNKPMYAFKINRKFKNNYSCSCSHMFLEDGTEKVLHNEISFNFTYENRKINVKNGWHIGTEDFDFCGSDNNQIVDDYNPGLLTILRKFLKTHKLEEDKGELRERSHADYIARKVLMWLRYHKDFDINDINAVLGLLNNDKCNSLIDEVRHGMLDVRNWNDNTQYVNGKFINIPLPSNYDKSHFTATFDYYKEN